MKRQSKRLNVDMMRFLDRFLGVPLCFFATAAVQFGGIFSSKHKFRPQKILFMELSEMGSTILADPAMRKAQAQFNAEIFFCIFKRNKESLFLLNTVKEKNIFVIRERSMIYLFVDCFRFLFWARKKGIDTVIDLELFARATALLTGLSGARKRVGFSRFYMEGLYRGNMLTHKVMYNSHRHIAKNFIALVNALVTDNGETPYSKTHVSDEEIEIDKLLPTEADKNAVWTKVKAVFPALDRARHYLVLVNPNASELLPQRRWSLTKYARLIMRVLETDPNAVVLITGSPDERVEMEGVVQAVASDHCVNFTGKVLFTELPVLYSISSFMLTNDSGPAHFAAVTDMPTFVLYGPETPDLYRSLGNCIPIYAGLMCSPCVTAYNHRKTPCHDNLCLKVITEQAVFERVKPYLLKRDK